MVLKPSERTPLTSLRVAALWREAGLPEDVFQVVPGRGDAGARWSACADMIFFTGSPAVGREVARAPPAERLVPVVLELGGKSPMIVLADADLPRAAHAAVWSGVRRTAARSACAPSACWSRSPWPTRFVGAVRRGDR